MKNITGIKCPSNILPINALRKLKIKREFRICSLCGAQKVGTEIHILMKCINDDIYKLRSDLFNPLGTGDLKFYQSQGLSTFWGLFFNLFY